jgi:hypothetical protein
VFLSTDSYHAANVSDDSFIRTIQTVVGEGVWLVVQVLEADEKYAVQMIQQAIGDDWGKNVEISRTIPLPYGRGESLFTYSEAWPASAFGSCCLASTPLIRYDGVVTACCNEEVIMGKGAKRLRRTCKSVTEVIASLDDYVSDPLLRGLATTGAGSLVSHPRYRHLADKSYSSICHLCWAMQDVTPESEQDAILRANALLVQIGGGHDRT